VRSVVVVCLVAQVAHADVIRDREREAARLELAHDFASLRRASELYAALGQRTKWIATTERAVRRHKTDPGAAQLMFELAGAFEGDALAAHMRAYLRLFGDDGDRGILAHAMLGTHAWERSCPGPTTDGLCARRAKAHPRSCAPKRMRWAAVARDQTLSQPGLAELREVVRRAERLPVREGAVLVAYADAKRVLADAELEVMIARLVPKLGFTTKDARERSAKRLDDWMKLQLGSRLRERYEAVIAIDQPRAQIASVLRIAQHSEIIAAQLVTGPHRLDDADTRTAYCERMTEIVEPLDLRAYDTYAVCAAKANELGVHDAWSASCMRALEKTRPEEFPPLVERVPSIGWIDPRT
jgi:hypothetical protein